MTEPLPLTKFERARLKTEEKLLLAMGRLPATPREEQLLEVAVSISLRVGRLRERGDDKAADSNQRLLARVLERIGIREPAL